MKNILMNIKETLKNKIVLSVLIVGSASLLASHFAFAQETLEQKISGLRAEEQTLLNTVAEARATDEQKIAALDKATKEKADADAALAAARAALKAKQEAIMQLVDPSKDAAAASSASFQ